MEAGWNGLPYRPISQFYQERFGGKVYKVPVTVADTCPNRMGLKGMKTCIFCDVWGSAAKSYTEEVPLQIQIETAKKHMKQKYKAHQFLVYFQAYTNSFMKMEKIQLLFAEALSDPEVKGCVVGTRPDCLSKALLDLWKETHQKSFVSVELGVQSFNDSTLKFYERGHSSSDSLRAIEKIKKQTNVDLGIHLMFGAPGETDEDVFKAALICNDLPIDHVKLHNLHVLKNTGLEDLYRKGEFAPIDLETYARRVRIFLSNLSPRLFVDRLAAFSPRWDELVAPPWTSKKMETHQFIVQHLRSNFDWQSKSYVTKSPQELTQQQDLAFRAGASLR